MTSFEIHDELWASELQQGLERYIDALYDSAFDEENRPVDEVTPDTAPANNTESGIPFCGCNVCQYREILSYVTVRVIKGYQEGKVTLVEDGRSEAVTEA